MDDSELGMEIEILVPPVKAAFREEETMFALIFVVMFVLLSA